MSHLVTLTSDVNRIEGPVLRTPDRALVMSGDPQFKAWVQDLSFEGKIRTGIWEASPGCFRDDMNEMYEYCFILEGVVELSEDNGEAKTYRAGDSFIMKPGFRGTWNTLEPVRKLFVAVERGPAGG